LGWALAGFLFLSVLAASLVYLYQDKIIQLFVAQANQQLKTKVQVGKISLSLWDKFPQVSVTLDQVQITESVPGSTEPLATAGKIFCTFNLKDMVQKKYRVRHLYLQDGTVQIKVLPNGEVNYHIFGEDTTVTANPKKEALTFNLEAVGLKNMVVTYTDAVVKQFYKLEARQVQANLEVKADQVAVQTQGGVYIHTIRLNKSDYFKEKETVVEAAFFLYPESKKIDLAPSTIRLGQADYQAQGAITYDRKTYLDLKIAGKNTNIQSLLSLLPDKIARQYGQYRSDGDVYFNGQIKGEISAQATPQVNVDFGLRQVSFYHPDYKQKIKNLSFTGNFTNGARHNAQTSVVSAKNIKGSLENRAFAGNLVYRNFQDPQVALDVKATLDVGHVLGLFPVAEIKQGSGLAKVALSFSGKVKALQTGVSRGRITASGDIVLQNVTLLLRDYTQPFRNLNGTFLIRKNDLAVTDFKGWLGASDFRLNGYFKNVIGWLFLTRQSVLVEADLESRFLDFDQLLSSSLANNTRAGAGKTNRGGTRRGGQDYKLVISPYLDFDLNAHVRNVSFRRFNGKNLRGNIRLKNRVISSPDMSLQAMGGRFGLKGTLDTRSNNSIKATTITTLDHIQVDSLFYVFENFGQNFLVQRHLKGELTAAIHSDLYFDSHLNPQTDKMEAEVKASIRNGQLNSFEPLQKLSAFADRRELANMRFSELSNTFYIQSRTVFIPEMEIKSNVSRASLIGIQGTHTFDQQMDYKFRIPLTLSKKRDKDEAYGTVTTVSNATPNLFLTLKGNESNYKIAYDKERVKNKIAQDLKREKQTITDILKGKKPEKKKEPEPQTGEYFDF